MKVVSRSRCDSPAPRGNADASAASGATQSYAVRKDMQTSAPRVSSLASLLAIALLLGHAALHNDTEEILGDTSTWMVFVIFLMVGAVVMRFDFIDIAREEAKKEGLQSLEQFSLIPGGRYCLILGVPLFLALGGLWGQGFAQDLLVDPLWMEWLNSQAIQLMDSISLTMLSVRMALHADGEELLANTPTWIALVIFLIVGAVVMRFDFIDFVKEEARKDGLEYQTEFSLIPAGRCRLILGFGVALPLALAVARHRHVTGQLSDEAAIFFLSAALVIGLATTASSMAKNQIAMKLAKEE